MIEIYKIKTLISLKEKHTLMSEYNVLRIYEPMKLEVTGEWRK
jgi:hypothetical protein